MNLTEILEAELAEARKRWPELERAYWMDADEWSLAHIFAPGCCSYKAAVAVVKPDQTIAYAACEFGWVTLTAAKRGERYHNRISALLDNFAQALRDGTPTPTIG